MEPTATLTAALENLEDLHNIQVDGNLENGEREEATHLLRSLADWLDAGGSAPNVESAVRNAGIETASEP